VRKDGPAIRDTLLWFGLIFGSGFLVYLWWGSWLAILPYIIYSVLYATTSDSRWHESSHGTAFKTDWMNTVLYEIASFMVVRQSTVWRWSHTRHHSDTIIRGRDPEIAVPRPPQIKKFIKSFLGLGGSISEFRKMFIHASGKIDPEVATYLPESEYKTVIIKARIYLAIYALIIALSIIFQTILPLMYIGLSTIFGTWLMPIYGLTQHAGLQENVLDHRLNCRTVYMNRINRYLYWNMNYHVEHHMFPLVPYHALPKLHALIKADCPPPYKSIADAFREIIPAVRKQMKDPGYFVDRKLPKGAGSLENQIHNKKKMVTGTIVNDKVEVCTIDELPKGEVIRIDFEEKTYAVYRTNFDNYYATEGICSHGNAHLAEGVVIDEMIECAKHNGRFNLKDGSPKRMPVCAGIATYKVEVFDNKVLLDLVELQNKQAKEKGISYKVVSNKNIATFIKELELEPEHKIIDYRPGQYIYLFIPPHKTTFSNFEIDEPYREKWEEQQIFESWSENKIYSKRNYSLATNPAKDSNLKFNIRIALSPNSKTISAGTGSSYVFNLKPGDTVKLSGPHGDFLIKETNREMVYLGGGAGMAPIRSHLSHLFETQKTKRKVSFWYGARSLKDLFYDDYFRELEKNNPNFLFNVALSEPEKEDIWNGKVDFIHQYLLESYLNSHSNPHDIEYYLCGPPAMVQAGLKMLKKLGVSDEMIAFDEF
jgi:Na(+)-translocating NADH:ubiquinone oxidoreductase F subunit